MAEPFLLRAKTPRLRPRNAPGVSPRDSEADVFTGSPQNASGLSRVDSEGMFLLTREKDNRNECERDADELVCVHFFMKIKRAYSKDECDINENRNDSRDT